MTLFTRKFFSLSGFFALLIRRSFTYRLLSLFCDLMFRLERETGLFFNMRHFEEMVLCGNWCEAEKYLSGFTKLGDDAYSTKIYFELRKQAFLEALDR